MKTIYYILAGVIALFLCASCESMDEIYKEHVVPNGIIYPGKATSPYISAGKNRVRVSWLKGSDPKVAQARIYWNNFTDSVEIGVPQGSDTIHCLIDGLEENTYTFVIKTFDAAGNVSVPVEVSGRSYGTIYQAGIVNREVSDEVVSEDEGWIVTWEKADTTKGAIFSEIVYKNSQGEDRSVLALARDISTTITNFKGGTQYKYRTGYIPEVGAVDTFYTDYLERTIPPQKMKKDAWTITASSHAADTQAPNGGPEKVIDDDINTYWHSKHKPSSPGYPHWLAVDMQRKVAIKYIELTPRSSYASQSFTKFRVEGSEDGITWNDYGGFDFEPVNGKVQQFFLEGKPATQYIKIVLTAGKTVHAHLAEFSVYGSYSDE